MSEIFASSSSASLAAAAMSAAVLIGAPQALASPHAQHTPSSAASAAQAAINHIHDWVLGTNGKVVSMAIPSDGSYGIEPGVIYSFPVVCEGGDYKVVQGVEISDFSRGLMTKTDDELRSEKAAVETLLLDETEARVASVSHPVA